MARKFKCVSFEERQQGAEVDRLRREAAAHAAMLVEARQDHARQLASLRAECKQRVVRERANVGAETKAAREEGRSEAFSSLLPEIESARLEADRARAGAEREASRVAALAAAAAATTTSAPRQPVGVAGAGADDAMGEALETALTALLDLRKQNSELRKEVTSAERRVQAAVARAEESEAKLQEAARTGGQSQVEAARREAADLQLQASVEASKTSLQRDLREVKGRLQACVKASSEAAGVLLLVERSLLTGDDGREEVVSQIEKAARVLLEATERSERRLAEAMEALYHALVSGRRKTSHAAERLKGLIERASLETADEEATLRSALVTICGENAQLRALTLDDDEVVSGVEPELVVVAEVADQRREAGAPHGGTGGTAGERRSQNPRRPVLVVRVGVRPPPCELCSARPLTCCVLDAVC